MAKPIPPGEPSPVGPASGTTPDVTNWLDQNAGPVSAEDAGLAFDGNGGGPQPLMPPGAQYEIQEYLDSAERALPLNDARVLCTGCVFGWIMAEVAPTKNKKPDGSDFLRFKGFCTYGGGRMSLGDIRPVQCNRYRKDERVSP